MRLRRLCAVAVLALLGTAPLPANAAEISCQDVYTPVSFGLIQQTMYGKLCIPQGATSVQVLVPGATYTSAYWDIPVQPDVRSVRLAMNHAGIATMAVDRIGTGRSSKPLSLLVTVPSQADAVHQVVQRMRAQFQKVFMGGHSLGSVVAIVEAATYHDVDGVLITGMTNQWDYVKALPTIISSIPVTLDPRLGRLGLDPGYLTTVPGSRYTSFHKPGLLNSAVVDYDESTKDVFATAELVTTPLMVNLVIPASRKITAPVMSIQTTSDYFCGTPPLGSDCSSSEALAASERPFYSHAPRVDAFVLTGYGHCFNFAPDSDRYHKAVVDWQRSL
ncbi:hypothetical protein UK23_38195 [Lentzea aerocolonigenes]|uniref:AB hydrolase-1 domain-containing protein n=1 Tax=Lentzea aerocolonigenes TaxID=68170 RepID=A0A0F0GI92_LENAE|nr:alpha/beta fold hydrolase [Lentzea aerocolonigenes]KJK42221.1 hypothetical protein UK23_38195 [Lentzea aerocolonigenes]